MISVIGAGPAGSYVAGLLAKNHEVHLYEEHPKIGSPFQCTGLLTNTIQDLVKLPDRILLNKIRNVRLYSPRGNNFDIKLKNPNFVINRTEFDQHLVDMAISKGVKLHCSHKLIGIKANKLKFKNSFIETDYIIGADGPMSTVAKTSGLFGKREFLIGKQFRAELKKNVFKDTFEVYFGAAPDFFGWIVPESEEVVRIGIATMNNINFYFDKFVKPKIKKLYDCQAGLIPIYNPSLKTSKDNIFLIGDAATQVKASTAGGIIQGMQAAKCVSQAIDYNKDYEKLWKKRLGRELYLHLLIKKVLYNLKGEEYDILLSTLKKDLGDFNRDDAIKSIFSLFIRNPSLSLFLASKAKYLYR